ncbi:DUF6531 domain-containing protein [Aquimarina addita]|uniref:DUF6531 domain-containing protein n=1 Tax=Aquimarina addita TaxID=870485 RepID=A0ABP6UL73_9FLAO
MAGLNTPFHDNLSRDISNTIQGDANYFGDNTNSVSANMNLTTGRQVQGIAANVENASRISENTNLSTGTAVTAQALNAVDTGIQAFGAITGLVDNISESVLLPALSALGMKGIASLPVSKQLDPVMGIDVHMVVFPPVPAPIPMPHPYIGVLLRPKDFLSATMASFLPPPPPPPELPEVPSDEQQSAANVNQALNIGHTVAQIVISMIGATVLVGGLPRVVAGTPTKSVPHFPMGPSFHPATSAMMVKNVGHAFLGSLLALADNDPISGGMAHMHNNCWDVGLISPHTLRPSKNTSDETKVGLQLFAPTGMIMSIPMGKTILTNPVPAPFNPMALLQKALKGAFGRLFGRQMRRLSDSLHNKINDKIGSGKLNNLLHRAACTVTGHPVDVASGMFFTDEEDFNLPGPIPLSWERVWYSKSDYKGPLGNGWHHQYDIGLLIDITEKVATLRMADGRPIAFVLPEIDTPTFNKAEQLEFRKNEEGEYYIWNIKEDLFYYFTKTVYNQVHQLRSIVNSNSFSIQFTYNKKGHLLQIIDSAHRMLTVENDAEGRIIKIMAPSPSSRNVNRTFAIASYTYSKQGNMIQQTNGVGDSMYFEYENNLMVKEIWRNDLVWHFRYDGTEIGSRCIHTWGDGGIYNHKLTYLEGKTIVENSLDQLTTYDHKGGLVYKKTDANNAEHLWLYDKDNQLISETDPMGNCHMYSYDDFGNKTTSIDPTGAKTTTEFINPKLPHKPTEIKDANAGIWKWKYDDHGNKIMQFNPMGASFKMTYQDGLLHTITDPMGNITKLVYDSCYNISEIFDNQGNLTKYWYDSLGRCTKIMNAKGAVQKRQFDLNGRIIKVHDFDSNYIELDYDGIDNLLLYKDAQQEVKYRYTGMWKMTSRTDQRGTTLYQYNNEEQLTKVINEKQQPYNFLLDAVGNVIQETSFDESIKIFERDLAGRVTQLTKASGKKVRYEYDNANRITEIIYQGNEIDHSTQSFEYNAAGQLIKAINKNAEIGFIRNPLGLITEETINDETIHHQYNASGTRIGLKSSLGAHINLEHDTFGNLINLKASQEDTQWEANYEYDSLGFELNRLLPGNVQQNFSYDTLGRLTAQQTLQNNNEKHKRRYTWGKNSQLHNISDSHQGTTVFGYTPTGHLEKTTFGSGLQQHRKTDSVGNLYKNEEKNDRIYSIGGRLEKKGSWLYIYNEEGFLVEKYKSSGSLLKDRKDYWQYAWNQEGMLEQVIRPDGHKVTFTYDALGRRLSKTFKNTITKWLWDGNIPLHEWKENIQTGQILSNSTIGDDGIITWVFEENSYIPTAKLKGTKKYSILVDHLGTPTSMYNQEGEAIWERSLDSYGNIHKGNHDSCPFMYQGQYYDPEIELAYNRFRYYDPEDGRYISVDPIGLLSGEFNFYSYVDDPNGWIDVFGLVSKIYSVESLQPNRPVDKGVELTHIEAVNHVRNGGDVIVSGGTRRQKRKTAKSIADDAGGNNGTMFHGKTISAGEGTLAHHHPLDGSGEKMPAHVFIDDSGRSGSPNF